jgi:cell wall-associated NlpC family hydrolase
MRTHARVLPRVAGTFLVLATIFGACPKPAMADPLRATAQQGEAKAPKKTKRKRSSSEHGPRSWTSWTHGAGWIRALSLSPADLAVATAREQLGKPYRWGAVGPSSFDCSGLTRFAWAAAGVSLPHSSRGQYASLHGVPLDKMKPGDIIYSPGHVGVYIGKGKMIHAPQSGKRVEVAPLHGNVVGAGRPSS